MKKFFAIAAALLLCVCASAQKVGIVGGFTSSELKLKDIKKSSVARTISVLPIISLSLSDSPFSLNSSTM